jgi:uncharacterized protein YjbI with pentapeptide repeats
MSTKSGRSEFEIRPADRDYSGLSIANRFLADSNIERSFFNGVNLTNCAFDSVKMNNTEFSEARVQKSNFLSTDLSGSDFVDSLFECTDFLNCNFEKGEWRDTTFRRCKFVGCNFDHTTVTLCVFVGCDFDAETFSTAEHRAFYFNTLSRCKFGRLADDSHFASRNFGIPAIGNQGTIVPTDSQISIEQLCLLNNVGRSRVIDVAGVAESICASLADGVQRRFSTLIFFSKIVRVLTDERRISPTSLIYLEQTIAKFAGSVDDQDLFTAAMTAVIEIRSALYSVATEAQNQAWENSSEPTRNITIRFAETYVRNQVEVLRQTLATVAGVNADGLGIESIRNGSTIIEFVSANVIAIGALLVAINFVLRQATITVKEVTSLSHFISKARKTGKPNTKLSRSTRRVRNKVPAVLQTGPVLPELAPVRAAVHRYGRVLVEMDEKAHITIVVNVSAEHMQGG